MHTPLKPVNTISLISILYIKMINTCPYIFQVITMIAPILNIVFEDV